MSRTNLLVTFDGMSRDVSCLILLSKNPTANPLPYCRMHSSYESSISHLI
jgi:hypothetical protein